MVNVIPYWSSGLGALSMVIEWGYSRRKAVVDFCLHAPRWRLAKDAFVHWPGSDGLYTIHF